MRSADRVTAVLLLVFSVAFAAGALSTTRGGARAVRAPPSCRSGLGIVMAALSLFFLVRSLRSPWPGRAWLPRGEGLRSILVVLGATVAFVALLKLTGMILGTALYLALLIRYLGRHRWWIPLGIAVSAALVNWLVFVHWLRVPLPELGVWISAATRDGLLRSRSRRSTAMAMGVLVGILIGALPGGPPSGVAMLLPLTFGMDPTSGIIMLAAMYAGTMYGGTITAVLINTPGESASVVTCLDGYQMALKVGRRARHRRDRLVHRRDDRRGAPLRSCRRPSPDGRCRSGRRRLSRSCCSGSPPSPCSPATTRSRRTSAWSSA